MTNLGDLLLPEAVVARARWQGRRQVLQEQSALMAAVYRLDPSEVHLGVLARERLGSTGVGEGVALPHARVRGLDRVVGGFARLVEPADFEAIDGEACDLVFMLLAPQEAGAEHLRALARVSRTFRQPAVREALRAAPSGDEIFALLAPGRANAA